MTTFFTSFWRRPCTRMGRWAVALASTFLLMLTVSVYILIPHNATLGQMGILLPVHGTLTLLSGLAAGATALLALLRRGERSWLVWLALVVGAWVVWFALAEIFFPH